jgi:hypothetical protein
MDYAGKTFTLSKAEDPAQGQVVTGAEYRVEGFWKDITGRSWMVSDGNPAAMHYGMRAGFTGLPIDDNVLYGKIGSLGHLVHVSELGDELNA